MGKAFKCDICGLLCQDEPKEAYYMLPGNAEEMLGDGDLAPWVAVGVVVRRSGERVEKDICQSCFQKILETKLLELGGAMGVKGLNFAAFDLFLQQQHEAFEHSLKELQHG